jgi:hypothetical protein
MRLPHFLLCLCAWQCFACVYPVLELCARRYQHSAFFFYYPNAGGAGLVFEPLHVLDQPYRKRRKEQVRLDWHRFDLNVGNIGRGGFRHQPAITVNLPHIDAPLRSLKHWPWRRVHEPNQHGSDSSGTELTLSAFEEVDKKVNVNGES